jgi:NADPH-dependent glutamate synthase beta subunit-like oxidoreductase
MKNLFSPLIFTLLFNASTPVHGQNTSHDLDIYGSTSAGIAAAIQSSKMGKSVLLIEPTNQIEGLITGGLGATDIEGVGIFINHN